MTTLLYWRRQVKPAENQKTRKTTTPVKLPHPYDLIIGLNRSDRKADLQLIDTANRLIALLKQCFSQGLVLCGEDLWRPLATRFLLKWPSLQAVQKAKPATLDAFYYLNGSRSGRWPQPTFNLNG
jgi:hypothetical protein